MIDVSTQDGQRLNSLYLVPRAHAVRVDVGSEELPVSEPFGILELQAYIHCGICSPPFFPQQGHVAPVYTASGKFSVGLNALRLDDSCGLPY